MYKGEWPDHKGVASRAQPPRVSIPPYRASGARLLVSGGGSMAAGAAEAAEGASVVAEVCSAQEFEEQLRLKDKYAGRRGGRAARGRRAGASGSGGGPPTRHVRSGARGPTVALLGPWRDHLRGHGEALGGGPGVQWACPRDPRVAPPEGSLGW